MMTAHWFRSGEVCDMCRICKGMQCLIWTDGRFSLHICSRGCDGLPERVKGLLS